MSQGWPPAFLHERCSPLLWAPDMQSTSRFAILFLLFSFPEILCPDTFGAETPCPKEVVIGVLATCSPKDCAIQWESTAQFLSHVVPGVQFTIRPLTYEEVFPVVEGGEVDFLVANPALYAACEHSYEVTRIATPVGRDHGQPAKTYSGVVICRANRQDLQSLEDLQGQAFMAVHPWSFGGWLMVQRELVELGIRVREPVRFADRQDRVVEKVLQGTVDAGTLCADDLERMCSEGRIDPRQLRVLRPRSRTAEADDADRSTRVYPQWAFARLRHTSDDLAKRVAAALLQMPADSEAARSADTAGWTIPLAYESVHECLRELRVGPYEHYGEVTLVAAIRAYWPWLLAGGFLIAVGWLLTGMIFLLNRRLRESESSRREAEKLAASGRLAASVAHEINNPMGGIVNCLHLVKAGLKANHPAQRYLAAAERESTRITRIVQQMLTLHRCRPEKARDFFIEDAIRDVLLMLRPLARSRGVRIESTAPDREETLCLPEESLRQVLFNLVTNAIEASSAGGRVYVDATQTDSTLMIVVSDHGAGIAPEILDRVLEPFFTTKDDCGAGLGLGLSISRGIVQSLGGRLRLDSQVGRGTRCSLCVPLAAADCRIDLPTWEPKASTGAQHSHPVS